jgi:hypothetical protein
VSEAAGGARVRRSPASASLEPGADGSVLVANVDTSVIHRIDRTGAAIWDAIDGRRDLPGVAAAAARTLAIRPAVGFADACLAFVERLDALGLVTLGLVERADPSVAEEPSGGTPTGGAGAAHVTPGPTATDDPRRLTRGD